MENLILFHFRCKCKSVYHLFHISPPNRPPATRSVEGSLSSTPSLTHHLMSERGGEIVERGGTGDNSPFNPLDQWE